MPKVQVSVGLTFQYEEGSYAKVTVGIEQECAQHLINKVEDELYGKLEYSVLSKMGDFVDAAKGKGFTRRR